MTTIVCVTKAVELRCLEFINTNDNCEVIELALLPISSTDEVNIVIPETWQPAKVETFLIQTFDVPTPFPTNLFYKFANLNKVRLRSHLEVITIENLKQANVLEELDVAFNNLTTIDDYAFSETFNLRNLLINSNQLTKIRRSTFAGLSSLVELHLDENRIDEIEDGALNFPKLIWLELQGNRLKVISDISTSLRLMQLKKLSLGNNPLENLELKTFLKYEHLEYLDIRNTGFDLDAFNISADDIRSSQSKINELNLSGCKIENGKNIVKLKIFPNLQVLRLHADSLTTMDLNVIQNGDLPKLSTIWIYGNNFDAKWTEKSVPMKNGRHPGTEAFGLLQT